MKIFVYDVAAENYGGLFVLQSFYNDVVANSPDGIEWIFAVSQRNCLQSTDKVKVLVFEKPKKSHLHRLLFEHFDIPAILKDLHPDAVISLQNMPVKKYRGKQLVYLHQSLQFCPKRFSVLRKAERDAAIRQNVICRFYKHALPCSDHIFVQTRWMKDAVARWIRFDPEKITVVPVTINVSEDHIKEYRGQETRTFFYPARPELYKNHKVIIEACKILQKEQFLDYKVLFAMCDEDGAYAKQLAEASENLPIEFIGALPYAKVWDMYAQSILLFPSYLETCGLPLLEARRAGAPILASDLPFSHEALDGYPNKEYFKFDDPNDLAAKMKVFASGREYVKPDLAQTQARQKSLMQAMLEFI